MMNKSGNMKATETKQVKIRFQEHLSINPLHQKTVPNHEGFIIAESSFIRRELHPKWTHNWNTTCVGLSKQCVKIWEQRISSVNGIPYKLRISFPGINIQHIITTDFTILKIDPKLKSLQLMAKMYMRLFNSSFRINIIQFLWLYKQLIIYISHEIYNSPNKIYFISNAQLKDLLMGQNLYPKRVSEFM